MKILHILRSEPDDMVRMFIQEVSQGQESIEVLLYQGEVDYGQLVKDIFASDRVISWWSGNNGSGKNSNIRTYSHSN